MASANEPKGMVEVLSTRRLDAAVLAELAEAGIRCTAHDFVDIVPRANAPEIQLQPHEGTVLVSSQNALHALVWKGVKVRCVGEKTAEKLRAQGAEVLSVHSGAASMSEHAVALGETCTFVCGSTRMPTVEDTFKREEAALEVVEVYDTLHASRRVDGPWDGILFFSPSGVWSYHASNAQLPPSFCIGATTGAVAQSFGHPVVLASKSTKLAVVRAAIEHFRS